jgi:hypothetical protein
MEKQLNLIQQLLDDSSALHGITIVITDTQGNFLTRPSGESESLKQLTVEGQTKQISMNFMKVLEPSSSNQLENYEWIAEMKTAISPIRINNRVEYYLWIIYPIIGRLTAESELSVNMASTLAIVTALLSLESDRLWVRRQITAVRELSIVLDQAPSSERLREWMGLLYKADKGIDFIGYASKEEGMDFEVTEFIFDKECSLLGKHFSLGEGFLGQVATTRQLGYWEHIARDPRSEFFIQNKVSPQTLFCYPILNNRTLTGLLFGGSDTEEDVSEGMLHLGQAVAASIGTQQLFQSLRSDRNTYFLRMSMLMEICKTLSVVKEIKRILFILVDLSLNLVQGSFTCAIFKQSSQKLNIVSRGISRAQAEKYMKDISLRYADQVTDQLSEHAFDGAGLYTFDGIKTMEFPLMYGNMFYGVLSIATATNEDFVEYKEFMQSLTIVGSAAIDRILTEQAASESDAVKLLHRSIMQWNPQAFAISQQAYETVAEYTLSIGLSVQLRKEIETVCLLYVFDPDLLEEMLEESVENIAIIRLAREVRQIRLYAESNRMFSESSQMVALALQSAERLPGSQNQNLSHTVIEVSLQESFDRFFAKRQVVDLEMTLIKPVAAHRLELTDLKQSIKELTLLSAREQESSV